MTSVLLAGKGEPVAEALRTAIAKRGIRSAICAREELAARGRSADLIVLIGTAADDGGKHALEVLAALPRASVALVSDAAALPGVLVIAPASPDELASRLVDLAEERKRAKGARPVRAKKTLVGVVAPEPPRVREPTPEPIAEPIVAPETREQAITLEAPIEPDELRAPVARGKVPSEDLAPLDEPASDDLHAPVERTKMPSAPPPAPARTAPAKKKTSPAVYLASVAAVIAIAFVPITMWLAWPRERERPPPRASRAPAAPRPVPPIEEPVHAPAVRVGPPADEPLEGSDADFSPQDLGIDRIPADSVRARPARIEDLLQRANRRRALGRHADAVALYREVLGLDLENARATAGMAHVYLEMGEAPLAVIWAQRFVRLRPGLAPNYVLLGDAFEAAGNHPAAVRAWEHALTLDPSQRTARLRLRD